MFSKSKFSIIIVLCSLLSFIKLQAQTAKINVLVFSKTTAFRHQSIDAGKTALAKMAKEKGFGVSFTEDAENFNELNLKNTMLWYSSTQLVMY